jgi:colicin import membrane protein
MADFMTNFDNQRQAYLEHYGVKGMRWGVINEQEPMGQYPQGQADDSYQNRPYSPEEYKEALKQADKIRKIDQDVAKKHRKEIRKKIVKGVVTTAIVAGIAVAALKSFGKKQLDVGDNPEMSAGMGLGLIGAKAKEFGSDVKTGFNTNIRETRDQKIRDIQAEAARKAAQKASEKAAAQKARDALRKAAQEKSAQKAAQRATERAAAQKIRESTRNIARAEAEKNANRKYWEKQAMDKLKQINAQKKAAQKASNATKSASNFYKMYQTERSLKNRFMYRGR